MRPDNIRIVARREYLQRIRSKGFWIGTVIFPLFMVTMTIVPSLLLMRSRAMQKIVVLDDTGRVAAHLRAERPKTAAPEKRERARPARIEFIREAPRPDRKAQEAELDKRVLDKKVDA